MAIQADTATAAEDLLFNGADGFTSGDPQAGIPPTQLSATFLNSVIVEINQAIWRCTNGDIAPVFGNTVASWQQLGAAIVYGIAQQLGQNYTGNPNQPWSRRTFSAVVSNPEASWRTWIRQSYDKNAANNTVQQTGHIEAPNNSQFWVTWEVCVTKTNDLTLYKNIVLRASCRRVAGSYFIQSITTVEDDGPLGATFDVIQHNLNGFDCIAVETTLPAIVGANFNIHAAGHLTNVTTGT